MAAGVPAMRVERHMRTAGVISSLLSRLPRLQTLQLTMKVCVHFKLPQIFSIVIYTEMGNYSSSKLSDSNDLAGYSKLFSEHMLNTVSAIYCQMYS